MARVALEKVSKDYPGVKAVDSVDLSIADQEFVVLVGPSGCGKSTTLRMIAGLEEISSGQIRIGDRIVNDLPPKNRDIAMVFQNYALYPHMTVYKNMAFALKLRGVPKAEIHQRVIDAAKILDIEHLLERKPKALSGGQRQRVAVGRAIVREPAAFIFYLPRSQQDGKHPVTTPPELKRLHHRLKTTTIYVTHDQEEAMTLGDRIVVMKDGKIQQADTPLRTYNHPVNRFVAGFIGMPPMNFFDGQIRDNGGHLAFEEGKLVYPKPPGGPASSDGNGNGHPAAVKLGELTMPGGGFTLALPSYLQETMRKSLNRHVVLGIRPEHFYLRDFRSPGCTSGADAETLGAVKMHLNVIEPLGNDMDVYMHTRLHDHVVGRVEAQSGLQRDSEQTMYVDLRKIHFFEPGETGMNLSLQSEPAHALA